MKTRDKAISHEDLLLQIRYDPETGVFTRIKGVPGYSPGHLCGSPNSTGHINIMIMGVLYKAHRLAWLYVYGEWPKHEIDHINGVRADNRICNLRDVDRRTNQQNRRTAQKSSKIGFMGVAFHKRQGKYIANITADGKRTYLRYRATPEEAHQDYLEAKRRLHAGCTI